MTQPVRRLCVFCASRLGADPTHEETARALGTTLAERGIGLVMGGGSVGLMGVIADAALAAGGEVDGVIPRFLEDREVGHRGLSRLHVVGSMHERKALMADLADAFVALPGGIGTFEEWFEVFTWAQLGLHRKPIALLDTNGFFRPLLALLDECVAADYLSPQVRAAVVVATTIDELLELVSTWEGPDLPTKVGPGAPEEVR